MKNNFKVGDKVVYQNTAGYGNGHKSYFTVTAVGEHNVLGIGDNDREYVLPFEYIKTVKEDLYPLYRSFKIIWDAPCVGERINPLIIVPPTALCITPKIGLVVGGDWRIVGYGDDMIVGPGYLISREDLSQEGYKFSYVYAIRI